jgi:endoglucanase
MVEHLVYTEGAVGSNPSSPTTGFQSGQWTVNRLYDRVVTHFFQPKPAFGLRQTASLLTLVLFGAAMAQPSAQPSRSWGPITAENYMRKLSPGINLGNTLEAIPSETSWGNPPTPDAYFKAVRAAGFRSVRIPAAWSQYSDSEHRIRPEWMARVTEVVKKATDAGLYAVLNVHWDGGWLQPTPAAKDKSREKLAAFWKQIATNFRDYDDRLLFAGTNEVHVEGQYGPPEAVNAEIQNGFNQVFVTTVRATGGRNRSRMLVVQGYNTDIDHTLKHNAILPKDGVKGRLMMEVHYYSPFNFTLNEKSDVWQWGAMTNDPKAAEDWANEAYVDSQFRRIKEAFVDRGVPVILGEYAAGLKPNFPGMRPFQLAWVDHVTRAAQRNGMVPMYWDIGIEIGLFHRATGAKQDPVLMRTILRAARP